MSFNSIIGQDKVKGILFKSVQDPFHAYIFEGPEGVGKRFTAFHFAQAILCTEDGEDACDQCISCKKMVSDNHPDYHFVEPDGNSIKDAKVEEIQKIMCKKPFEGKYIITVINDADSMTTRAQNRLLKTLEEPNKNTITILLTENMSKLLPTITSRCMILKFPPITDDLIHRYLMKNYSLENKDASVLTAFSKGRIGLAKKICISDDFNSMRTKSIDIAKKLFSCENEEIFEIETELANQKENIIEFLDMIEYWYRDIAIIASSPINENILINIDYLDALLQEANRIGYEKAITVIDIIEESKMDLSKHLNFNLVIKNMLLKIQEG